METINKRYKYLSIKDINHLKKENNKLQELINIKTKTLLKSNGSTDDILFK